MLTIEQLKLLERVDVDLSTLFKGGNARLLQGKTPEQTFFLQSVVASRIRYKNGDSDALKKFPKDPRTQQLAQELERELAVIHREIAIPIETGPFVGIVLDMHGEIKLGEVNNNEGIT